MPALPSARRYAGQGQPFPAECVYECCAIAELSCVFYRRPGKVQSSRGIQTAEDFKLTSCPQSQAGFARTIGVGYNLNMDTFEQSTTVDAVYRHGVFEPLQPVNLAEEQRVRLQIAPSTAEPAKEWLARVQGRQAEFLRENEPLPDSAPDIAADRLR